MINIQFTGINASYHQIDRSYNLPHITGAVQWNGTSRCFEVSTINGWQRIDNNINLHSDINLHRIAQWVEEKMAEEAREKELRSKYPALDQAYNELEFIKGLIADDIQQSQTT